MKVNCAEFWFRLLLRELAIRSGLRDIVAGATPRCFVRVTHGARVGSYSRYLSEIRTLACVGCRKDRAGGRFRPHVKWDCNMYDHGV